MRVRTISVVVLGSASLALAGCGGASSSSSGGEDFPSASMRWVVPYAPGGGTDSASRLMAGCMEDDLGQSFIIENLPSGNGVQGALDVIESEPDGYTVGLALTTGMTVTPLIENVPFTKDDITPIGGLYQFGLVIGTSAGSPYDSAEALFDQVRKNPGKVSVAVSGTTGPTALAFQFLEAEYGLDFNVIPMEGAGAVNTALLGGQVDIAGLGADLATIPYVESGDFEILASFTEERWSVAPDAPTLDELGFGEATFPTILFLLHGPKDLPDDLVATLESSIAECLTKPDVIDGLGGEEHIPTGVGAAESQQALDEAQETFERLLAGA